AALDFLGIDVLARGRDDDVLDAPREVQVAVAVEVAYVARVQPALANGPFRRALISKIADGNVRSAHGDFADAAVVGLENSNLDSWERPANRAHLGPLERIGGGDGGGFGQTVAFVQLESHRREFFVDFRRQCRATAYECTELASELLVNAGEEPAADV